MLQANANAAVRRLREELPSFQAVDFSTTLLDEAMRLAEVYGLRGYDAVQLASAISLHSIRSALGADPLTLVSSDAELNAAAVAEGLMVDDPNQHP